MGGIFRFYPKYFHPKGCKIKGYFRGIQQCKKKGVIGLWGVDSYRLTVWKLRTGLRYRDCWFKTVGRRVWGAKTM